MSSRRTALFLYVLLVVLPAVVFGSLLWRQLHQSQQDRLSELPKECADAANRLGLECASEFGELIGEESQRPFEEYRPEYFVDNLGPLMTVSSPVTTGPKPDGIVGWFSFRPDPLDPRGLPPVEVLRGPSTRAAAVAESGTQFLSDLVTDELVEEMMAEGVSVQDTLREARELEGYFENRRRKIRSVVLNVAQGPILACEEAVRSDEELMKNVEHDVFVQYFSLRVVPRGRSRPPWIVAYRKVVIPRYPALNLPSCIDAISHDVLLVQGFVVDPDWLFTRMPRAVATRVLSSSQAVVLPGEALSLRADVYLFSLGILPRLSGWIDRQGSLDMNDFVFVQMDASELRRVFRIQNAWFIGMALVLTISMAIGILLLLSSIQASRAEAERTRNFVASVTHELRTPIAAVKLYGEMLHDGWVTDEQRRTEYLARIVHESDRLGGLVDRVLLRRKLFDQEHTPKPGDLNAEIRVQQDDLEVVAGRRLGDVAFDLAPDLPRVLLMPEGVHVVVQNLVENARKYAPVDHGTQGSAAEPILVRTRVSRKGNVLLEVLDRGPGIAEGDRSRVFEAFLRLGDEHTRRTQGTGLGLHLVALQVRAMKGRVRALPRAGGGTVMQVRLRRA